MKGLPFTAAILLISMTNLSFGSDVANSLSGVADCALIINGNETIDYPAVGQIHMTMQLDGHEIRLGNCSATVIAPTKILTAAHCVDEMKVGENGIQWNGESLPIKAIHIHPDYQKNKAKKNGSASSTDLAVVELGVALKEKPHPIELSPLKTGDTIELVGYGFNESIYRNGSPDLVKSGSGVKRKGYNQVESFQNGAAVFNGRMENRNIFGFSKVLFDQIDLIDGSDVSVAKGDSGGAVFKNGKLVGVISSSMSGVGLPNPDMTYENQFTPLYTETNQNFLKSHIK